MPDPWHTRRFRRKVAEAWIVLLMAFAAVVVMGFVAGVMTLLLHSSVARLALALCVAGLAAGIQVTFWAIEERKHD